MPPYYRETTPAVPVGTGHTVSNLQDGVNSRTFDLPAAQYIMTFRPRDRNDPGVMTLYNSAGTALITMRAMGYADFSTPAITGCYFNGTKGAQLVAVISPYDGGRQ